VVAVSVPVDAVPLVACVPVQPCEAVQPVALVELHVSVDLPPDWTVVGAALKVTVGAGVVVDVLWPPEPPPPQAASSEAEAASAKSVRDIPPTGR
jgi:hypothetical protein